MSRKLSRILFLVPNLINGGAERVLVNLVNNLDKTKYEVTVQTIFDVGINQKYLDESIIYIPGIKKQIPGISRLLKLFSPHFLYKMLIRKEYDIVISYLEGFTARIVAGAPNSQKTICWIHCTMAGRKLLTYAFRNYQEAEACYKKIGNIVYVSKGVKRAFESFLSDGIRGKVLYNINDADLIRNLAKCELPFQYKKVFSGDEFKLCYVGKLIEKKGINRLAAIHVRLVNAGYRLHTYVIGSGKEEERIKKYIEQNGCKDSFSLLGYQLNPYQFMNSCDWFVCASYEEGFSTAATEAMILGLPVVAAKVSGMEELLGENNQFGIIVENNENALYEEINRILDSPQLTEEYRLRAKKWSESFNMKESVKKVECFLDSI